MKAISDHYGIGEAACEAVAAGCDVILVCESPALCMQAYEALVMRAERDAAFAQRLRSSAERSLEARRRHRPRPLAPDAISAELEADKPLQDRIAHALQRLASAEA
jgi:beta-N-acetylhexosaminidase